MSDETEPAAVGDSEQVTAAEGFQFEGKSYEMSSLMLAEARAIQRTTGLKPAQFEDALNEWDAEAITALVWVGRRRHGEPNLRFEDVDGDIATFRPHLLTDEEAAARIAAAKVGSPGKSDSASPNPSASTDGPEPAGTPAAEG